MKRLEFLDSLRGLAALYVLVFHLVLVPEPALELPAWAAPFILFGGSGVLLFFVISGFSLCLTMPSHERSGSTLFSFYTKRLLRIAPLFYVVLAVMLARMYLTRGLVPSVGDVLGQVFFVFNLIPGQQDSVVFAGWTVGVEMVFYAIFPALYLLFPTLGRKLLAYAAAALASRALLLGLENAALSEAARERYVLLSVLHYVPVFLIGMVAFDLYAWLHARNASGTVGAAFLIVGAASFTGAAGGWLGEPPYAPLFWQALAYGALLLGLAFCPVSILVNRATRFIGSISYSVYLWHGAVIYLIRGLFPRIYSLGLPSGVAFLLCVILTLTLVVPLSWLSFRLIEQPGIEWARKLVSSRRAPALAQQAG